MRSTLRVTSTAGLLLVAGLLCVLLAPPSASAHELCANNVEFPSDQGTLNFCSAYSYGCCSNTADAARQREWLRWIGSSLPQTDACAVQLKSISCSACDAWGAHLFGTEEAASAGKDVVIPSTPTMCTEYCEDIYTSCGAIRLAVNPFLGNRSGAINEVYKDEASFCKAMSTLESGYCFSGTPFDPTNLNNTVVVDPGNGAQDPVKHHALCLTRISSQRYLSLQEFQGRGAKTLLVNAQSGRVMTYNLSQWGGTVLPKNELYLNLTSQVVYSGELGMYSIAFHPDFAKNSLFYVSFTCDSVNNRALCPPADECGCVKPECTSTSPDLCRYVSTVAEYSAASKTPVETRKIFRLGQPFANHNGGQITFPPTGQAHLLFLLGDGGGAGDPYNMAQNPRSLLGKVLKLDLSNKDTGKEYGTFASMGDGWRPEIWAAGLRNPWRCDWVPGTGEEMLLCADVGQNTQEELTLVTAGSNHGWPFLEGTYKYRGTPPSGTPLVAPIFTYQHSNGPRSVTGGIFHKGSRDACKKGTFLSADLYGGGFITELLSDASTWATQEIEFLCTGNSTGMPCLAGGLKGVVSFGHAYNETFVLADSGVYLVTEPEVCGIPLGQGCAERIKAQGSGGGLPIVTPSGSGPVKTTTKPVPSASGSVRSLGLNLMALWAVVVVAASALLGL